MIQVHIDHGGAVLKWAEGINDKVGSIEAAAVHWGGRQTPTWNLSLVSFLRRNGLDMIYWLRMYGGTAGYCYCWCCMHVIRKVVDISSIFYILYIYIYIYTGSMMLDAPIYFRRCQSRTQHSSLDSLH